MLLITKEKASFVFFLSKEDLKNIFVPVLCTKASLTKYDYPCIYSLAESHSSVGTIKFNVDYRSCVMHTASDKSLRG